HAEQHLGPVLRLETTGARVYLDDRVAGVVLAAEEAGQLEVAQLALDLLHPLRELAEGVGITFLRQLEVHARLVGALAQALPAVERRLESRGLAGDGLRLLGVAPEVGGGGLLVQEGRTALEGGQVKGASRAPRRACRCPARARAGRRGASGRRLS